MFSSLLAPIVLRSRLCLGNVTCNFKSQGRWKSTFPTALFQSLSQADQDKVLELRTARQVAREAGKHGPVGKTNSNRKANVYNQQESDLIIQCIKAGASYAELGRTLDRCGTSIRSRYLSYLQYRDSDAPRVKCVALGEEIASIVKQVKAGISFRQIARQLQVSQGTIRKRYDAVCSPEDRRTGEKKIYYTDDEIDTIKLRIREGISLVDIAVETGRSVSGIKHVIHRYGIRASRGGNLTWKEKDAIRPTLETCSRLTVSAEQSGRDHDAVV
ncbi:uncharacterized protein RCC_00983 [Ramularia collo-cygni]|uniref:Transposase IS30-like HTH domain-containing protein n=1 Tax=Ramularia collo-cygni TaxID=112498 RepID=A0A2D3URK4_9PEZI|nr:uncharacterized protein RCC_00983 [Ramularia collo-cygni]CZT15080.1 uncharacterized protein RCC_00983 [Ramularia collo-cygni]